MAGAGNVVAYIGAASHDSGATINDLLVSYTGRLSVGARPSHGPAALSMQYGRHLLTTGTWHDVPADFVTRMRRPSA